LLKIDRKCGRKSLVAFVVNLFSLVILLLFNLSTIIMQNHTLTVSTRDTSKKGTLNQLRNAGQIPANIHGKGNAKSISVSKNDFKKLQKAIGGGASLIELTDEKGENALTHVQSIQVNPISKQIDHIDFHEVARGESFVAHVPVQLLGVTNCEGVRNEGGVIDHKTLELEIRCRPSKLPENVPVDVTDLKVGEAIHVDDLPQIDGVEYLANGIQVVVSCQPPTVAAASSESSEAEAVEADSVPVINEQVEEASESGDSEG
jgi:large subunit ribosomal protein L25